MTARPIEFDVVAPGTTPRGDIKLTVLLQEAFRNCKALAGGDGVTVLEAAGMRAHDVGVDGRHRTWERAQTVTASAVPPIC